MSSRQVQYSPFLPRKTPPPPTSARKTLAKKDPKRSSHWLRIGSTSHAKDAKLTGRTSMAWPSSRSKVTTHAHSSHDEKRAHGRRRSTSSKSTGGFMASERVQTAAVPTPEARRRPRRRRGSPRRPPLETRRNCNSGEHLQLESFHPGPAKKSIP